MLLFQKTMRLLSTLSVSLLFIGSVALLLLIAPVSLAFSPSAATTEIPVRGRKTTTHGELPTFLSSSSIITARQRPQPRGRITTRIFQSSRTSEDKRKAAQNKIDGPDRTSTTTPSADSAGNKASLSEFSTPDQLQQLGSSSFSYVEFAQTHPFVNNIGIATVKTAAADLLAQTVIAGTPITEIDVQRSLLFCLFGALYLGAFQYAYQVQVFKRLFDVDKFTSQPWAEKLQDIPGLKALGAQTGLDLTVLTLVYLPTFYIFKASVFSGSLDPAVWVATGMDTYQANFSKDEADLLKVWLPADLVCFSVPLYLRLPVRHIVSFVWTAYLSFARGGH